MKKVMSLAMAGMAVLILGGCSTGEDEIDGMGGSSLIVDIVQNGSRTSYDSTINLMNSDSSSENICDAYSAPANSNTWVRLSGMPISIGGEHEWGSDRCDQEWDLKVVACDTGETSIKTYYRGCFTTTYFTFKNW